MMKHLSHKRGFTGIGLLQPEKAVNVSGCLRSAACFDADLILIDGERYIRKPADTMNVSQHIPTILTKGDIWAHIPQGAKTIAVEFDQRALPLHQFAHPESAVYLFGPEDGSIGQEIRDRCIATIFIPSLYCLNLCMAVTLVLYDRFMRTIPQNLNRTRMKDGMKDA